MSKRSLVLISLALSVQLAWGDCPVRESPKEEDTWFIQDRVIPSYVYDAANFKVKFETEKNGFFEVSLTHVKIAVDKRVGLQTCIEMLGYNSPSFRDPHRIKIFVNSHERERAWNERIKKI